MTRVFIAQIKDKRLELGSPTHRALFMDFLSKNDGKSVRIELAKNPISDKLRAYYFAVVVETVKSVVPEWKHKPSDDIHEILKQEFNGFNCFSPMSGKVERYGRSAMSDSSNTHRAMDYIEKIRVYLLENYEVDLPSTDEYKSIINSARLK